MEVLLIIFIPSSNLSKGYVVDGGLTNWYRVDSSMLIPMEMTEDQDLSVVTIHEYAFVFLTTFDYRLDGSYNDA